MSSSSKKLLLKCFYSMKGFDLLRFLKRKSVTILVYHRFSKKKEPFKLKIEHFERQIQFFKNNYNIISLSHYLQALNGNNILPVSPLIITIDDGYRDNFTVAFPILQKYSVPATIFLTTDFIDHRAWLWSNKLEYILRNSKFDRFSYDIANDLKEFQVDSFSSWHQTQLAIFNILRAKPDHEKNKILNELARDLKVEVPDETQGDFMPLTWEEIRSMHCSGIEFGSHSCSHAILSRVGSQDLHNEIVSSKKIIQQKLQSQINSFCYPNGQPEDYSVDVIKELEEAEYAGAVTTISGLNHPQTAQRFELKRLAISSGYELHISRQLV